MIDEYLKLRLGFRLVGIYCNNRRSYNYSVFHICNTSNWSFMKNNFFTDDLDHELIRKRILELESARIGFYSIGLYPASLAYNCVMQTDASRLLLAPRPNRQILGAFTQSSLEGMDPNHVNRLTELSFHKEGNNTVQNTLADLILRCELVVLCSNSNHINDDIELALSLQETLNRDQVVLACLSGSFCHDNFKNESYILCERYPNLAFFSGFHRHDALRNPLDSFTANFCHPNSLIALLGSHLLDQLSPNIQVSAGVHNVEAQFIKASKNIGSIFAGFASRIHCDNPGLLPTVLTLLLEQCLDQAASVSMCRDSREKFYDSQPIPLTELCYGVQKIEAALVRDGEMCKVRDHTFSQLTAVVADVRGSMMKSSNGKSTRNFIAGEILANYMIEKGHCPPDIDHLYEECEKKGLKKGSLEGLKSLRYWPQIVSKYNLPLHDCSMANLLYISIFGTHEEKETAYKVMIQSRDLTNYCQESVKPNKNKTYSGALNDLINKENQDLFVNVVEQQNYLNRIDQIMTNSNLIPTTSSSISNPIKIIDIIENYF